MYPTLSFEAGLAPAARNLLHHLALAYTQGASALFTLSWITARALCACDSAKSIQRSLQALKRNGAIDYVVKPGQDIRVTLSDPVLRALRPAPLAEAATAPAPAAIRSASRSQAVPSQPQTTPLPKVDWPAISALLSKVAERLSDARRTALLNELQQPHPNLLKWLPVDLAEQDRSQILAAQRAIDAIQAPHLATRPYRHAVDAALEVGRQPTAPTQESTQAVVLWRSLRRAGHDMAAETTRRLHAAAIWALNHANVFRAPPGSDHRTAVLRKMILEGRFQPSKGMLDSDLSRAIRTSHAICA